MHWEIHEEERVVDSVRVATVVSATGNKRGLVMKSREERFLFFNFFKCLFLRESMNRGGAEREGDRGSQAGSTLTAESLMQGSNALIVRS